MNKYVDFIKDGANQQSYLKWLRELTSKSRKSLLGLLTLNILVAVASVLVSLVNKSIVDKAQDRTAFGILVTIMVLLQLFSIIGSVLVSLLESTITEKYACQVRRDLFEQFLRIPWKDRSVFHSEELVSRITSDVEQITSGVSKLLISGGALIVKLVLAFILLWNYAPALAVAIIVIAPVGAFAGKIISKEMNRIQENYQQTEADYRIFLQERLSKVEVVQIFGQEDESAEKLNEIQDRRLQLVRKKNRWKMLGAGVVGIVFTGAQMIAFVVGALMVSSGAITFGVMTAFLSLVGQIQGPVYSLANQIPQIVGVLASAGRIMEISELEKEHCDLNPLEAPAEPLGLRADHFSVGYNTENILSDISFNIEPGSMVLLAGKSGIGKTTLLRAVMGFLEASSGEIYFYSDDGLKKSCGLGTRKWISYVPQGNTLMFGTIADNLRMGKSDATEEEMKEALRVADVLDFVEGLPDSLETKIGEKAVGISEGQAQRIAIARALLKNSAVLILDEATSALDEKTEAKILGTISESHHQTCLFVSHRRYLEKYADAVIEL